MTLRKIRFKIYVEKSGHFKTLCDFIIETENKLRQVHSQYKQRKLLGLTI